jgi:two-component system LytT family sensor kinase
MVGQLNFKIDKRSKIELIFFLTYYYVFRMLTDFEYNFWERHITGIDLPTIEANLAYGTSDLIAFYGFYRILQYLLIKKKTGQLILFVFLFLIGYSFYNKIIHLLYANLPFFSDGLRVAALKYYKFSSIGYSVAYMLKEILAISSLAYFTYASKQNEQLKVLKEQQLISEITYLKAQLQPHFFFNTLNNIYALALQQSDKTAPLVAKLAEMMRYILYRADKKFVTLKDEVAFVQNYVEVENIRYRSAIKITFEVQGIDDVSRISPLLLLPFIENAFKHGIEEEAKEGFVQIVICKTENELTLEVKNSIAKDSINVGGIGLINVRKRLDILYPEKYSLEILNDRKIYQVTLTLETI